MTGTRVFGDIDVAEDAVQDAFAEAAREGKHAQAALLHARDEDREDPPVTDEDSPVRDDRLRLIFTCCHPARQRLHR